MIALALALVTVTGAWSRPAFDTAVVYATLHDAGRRPVALVGASSPVARTAELHQSTTTPGGAMHAGTMNPGTMTGMNMPVMAMHPVSRIVVPPHGTTALHPGGYHIMLLGLRHPLRAGERFPVTLRFSDGERVTVSVAVENRAM